MDLHIILFDLIDDDDDDGTNRMVCYFIAQIKKRKENARCFCCCYCCSGIQLIYWIAYKSINLLIRRIDVSLTIIIIICVCGYFIGQIYYFQSFHLHFFNHKIQTSNPNLSHNLKCNRKYKRNGTHLQHAVATAAPALLHTIDTILSYLIFFSYAFVLFVI